MDIRPCPRCCKLVPVEAAFCRRCGVAIRPQTVRGDGRVAGGSAGRNPYRSTNTCSPDRSCGGGRWASAALAATATAALGAVLALFAVSGPRVAVHDASATSEPEHEAADLGWADPAGDGPSLAAGRGDRDRRYAPSFAAARKQSTPTRRHGLASNPPLDAFASRNPPRYGGPQITAVAAAASGRGRKVTIRGSRLGGARRVLFIGTQRGRAEARFVVWDDNHLIASVPDLGPWRQDVAVAVETGEGVAVSVPADARAADGTTGVTPPGTVSVVSAGDVFAGADGSVVFVEGGAAARAAGGGTLFIRRGGSAWGHGGGDCLMYCERGVVRKSDVTACDIVEVEAVNVCVVTSLFHYTGR